MAEVNQLHRVTSRPVPLADNAKSRVHTSIVGYNNDILNELEVVPQGALAGMIATIDEDGMYDFCDDETYPAAMFGLDASGDDFESMRPRSSGKMTVHSLGYITVEVYETRTAAQMNVENSLMASYIPGTLLYCSAQGFLTTELSTSEVPVALIEKAPTSEDQKMIVKLLV